MIGKMVESSKSMNNNTTFCNSDNEERHLEQKCEDEAREFRYEIGGLEAMVHDEPSTSHSFESCLSGSSTTSVTLDRGQKGRFPFRVQLQKQ